MSNDERREVRAKVRTYKDKETGEDKNVYTTVGTAWVSEHGSKISIQLESVPVTPEWDGRLFINKPYEKKDQPMTQSAALNGGKEITPDEIDDKPVDLSSLPF